MFSRARSFWLQIQRTNDQPEIAEMRCQREDRARKVFVGGDQRRAGTCVLASQMRAEVESQARPAGR